MAGKKRARKGIIVSLLLVFLAASMSVSFFTFLAIENTVSAKKIETTTGKVVAVTEYIRPSSLCIQLDDGGEFWIPSGFSKLLAPTEYDIEMLQEALTDKTIEIEYVENSTTHHIVNIKIAEEKLDFHACIRDYHSSVHFGILLFVLMSFAIIWAAWYYTFWKPEKNKRFPDWKRLMKNGHRR